ncbi:hypothetical protein BJD66_gp51 [Gordonia phage Emalyn]|uniref:Lipoprotein n=1 Tax=Gordonia phage Emalyn TaxID=1821552 RepID=A0A142KBY7_9CAUD|nr:hypothetical protein BJD66_gp51 [Gordonia phage Emalyn]AMS03620.1 hypothetical protein SEA_EMALYN_51 [Gordonia phage Emalyn]UMO76175.1 hypothetical protein SEA_AMOK_53 [Gordonia phage Amok]
MRKFLLILPAAALLTAACSSEAPEPKPASVASPITAPATVQLDTSPISDDAAEEAVIQGYIKSARQFLDQGVITRDRVTTALILSELPYLTEDQAERVKEAILA